MDNKVTDYVIAFFSADALVMVVTTIFMKDLITSTMIAVSVGFFGGAAGIMGKWAIQYIKKKIFPKE